jgi:hypothetical protein
MQPNCKLRGPETPSNSAIGRNVPRPSPCLRPGWKQHYLVGWASLFVFTLAAHGLEEHFTIDRDGAGGDLCCSTDNVVWYGSKYRKTV